MGDLVSNVQVGCQGWNYKDWIAKPGEGGALYPQGTRPAEMLELYARFFRTVEVDSTFYGVPAASTIENWLRRTPPEFTFSLKLPQEITHTHALRRESFALLEEFCERARLFSKRLIAILIQLPPQFDATPENARALQEFLPRLPSELRFSIEFRNPEWMQDDVLDLLDQYGVSLALVEGIWLERAKLWRAAERMKTDFACVRFMGARDLTRFDVVQRAQDENLNSWREVIKRLAARMSNVHVCFSNYYEGHAPASANKLMRLLGQKTIEAKEVEKQPSLF
ncbi:MAG: DUF72 domain-containing protein [Pyrinomonadaceae bacterium]|nr:DUF72 domain-containing protein [Pyrinomonadaceae bacterium]